MSDGLSMILVTAMVTLASVAIANQLGLERDGAALLDGITGPRVFAAYPSGALRDVPALPRSANEGAARAAP